MTPTFTEFNTGKNRALDVNIYGTPTVSVSGGLNVSDLAGTTTSASTSGFNNDYTIEGFNFVDVYYFISGGANNVNFLISYDGSSYSQTTFFRRSNNSKNIAAVAVAANTSEIFSVYYSPLAQRLRMTLTVNAGTAFYRGHNLLNFV